MRNMSKELILAATLGMNMYKDVTSIEAWSRFYLVIMEFISLRPKNGEHRTFATSSSSINARHLNLGATWRAGDAQNIDLRTM